MLGNVTALERVCIHDGGEERGGEGAMKIPCIHT